MSNRIQIITVVLVIAAMLPSCKKEEGRGGNSSIVGTVIMRELEGDHFFSDLKDEHPAYGEDVYIIYGENTGVGDKADVAMDGSFEFKYLRTGNYKVYVISDDSSQAMPDFVPDTIFMKEVIITDKKETVNSGTFIIYNFL